MFKKSIINLRECLLFGHNNSGCSSVAILRVQKNNSSTTATMCTCPNAYLQINGYVPFRHRKHTS